MIAVGRTMPGFAGTESSGAGSAGEGMNLARSAGAGMNLARLSGAGRIITYILMLLLTFSAGWLLRRTSLAWMAAGGLQLATGAVLALLFRFAEPLRSLKLLTDRPGSV